MTDKLYLGKSTTVTITCPKCRHFRSVGIEQFTKFAQVHRIRVRCPCGHQYSVDLEKRISYRRAVNLAGTYKQLVEVGFARRIDRPMVVVDISRDGLRFQAAEPPSLEIGDILRVTFTLDNHERTPIEKRVEVRNIDGNLIGTRFASFSISDANDKAIAFYLF